MVYEERRQNKAFAQKENQGDKKTTNKTDSIVEACLPFADLLNGEIVHVSFDCPRNLRITFNSVTKANGTSSCHVLRGFMQAYIVANHYQKACFPNTVKPIKIENVIMPTYVKKRVRRYAIEEIESSAVRCHYCRNVAVDTLRYLQSGEIYPLCAFHFEELLGGGNWSLIEECEAHE